MPIRLHHDDPDLLYQAIEFTARETGFNPRLVEKDYFCSVVLEHLAGYDAGMIFKGGTCLSKVHRNLYRLSEDLDFSIHTPANATRGERSRSVDGVRAALNALPDRVPGLRILEGLRGANNSTQYNAQVGYESLIDGQVEPVSIEIGVREPILLDPHEGMAKTLLLHPITTRTWLDPYSAQCLGYEEAMAEKLRAAMTRRQIAIRDYFDVDDAVQVGGFDPLDTTFLDLLERKLAIAEPVDVSKERMVQLERLLESQLRPVLREQDFANFDLQRAVKTVRDIERAMKSR